MPKLTGLRPMLGVPNLAETIDFYVTKLGFTCAATMGEKPDQPTWANLQRDGIAMMFNEFHTHDDPEDDHDHTAELSGSIYLNTDDVDALHVEFTGRGVQMETEPETMVYGMREFALRDNSGYLVLFGSQVD